MFSEFQCVINSKDTWMDERTDERAREQIGQQAGRLMGETDGWADRRIDRRTGGWTDRQTDDRQILSVLFDVLINFLFVLLDTCDLTDPIFLALIIL